MKTLFLIIVLTSSLFAQNQLLAKHDTGDALRPLSNLTTASLTAGDTLKTYQLPEIVVTATRREKDPTGIGRSISVVSVDQARKDVDLSVTDALTRQEGLYVVGTGQNPGMVKSIFLRGTSNNHTAIMIDDIRLHDPSGVNNALDVTELSMAGLDRIEIVRNSHSTLYGSSAIGGVLNFITRKKSTPGIHADGEMKAGWFGEGTPWLLQNLFVNYTSPAGLYLNSEFSNVVLNGIDATRDSSSTPPTTPRDRDGFRKRDVVLKAGFTTETSDLYASFFRTTQKADVDKGAFLDDDNATVEFQRSLLTYGVSRQFTDAFGLKFIGGYSEMRRFAVDDSSVVGGTGQTDHTYVEGEWKGTSLTNELQGSLRLKGLEGVVGAGAYRETMTSRSYFYMGGIFGPFEFATDLDTLHLASTTKSLFAHFDVSGSLFAPWLAPLSLGVGIRFNDHSAYGANVTYEINPAVHITDRALAYVSYSTGFNAPSLYQLYSPDRDFTSGLTRGNMKLTPETSAAVEIGWKQSVGSNYSFTASYFRTAIENAIEYVYLWDKNIPLSDVGTNWLRNDFRGDTYLNIGRQTIKGLEFTMRARLSEQISVEGNVTLLSGTLDYQPSDVNQAQTLGNHVQIFANGAFVSGSIEVQGLTRRPNTMNLSLGYAPIPEWSLRVHIQRAGARDDIAYDPTLGPYGALGRKSVDAYTLVHLIQHWSPTSYLSLSAKVENVLNTDYSEIIGYRTRGRSWYVSVRYQFSKGM